MLERDLQDYLYLNPEILFPGQRIEEKKREFFIEGRRIDLLFRVDGIVYIVELKRGSIQREHVGQIAEYYGLLRGVMKEQGIRMILAAPSIPQFRRVFLEELGIQCVEIPSIPAHPAELNKVRQEVVAHQKAERVQSNLDASVPQDYCLTFEEASAPDSQITRVLAHRFLRDSLRAVKNAYPDYELKPLRMGPSQDVYCDSGEEEANPRWHDGGAWWGYTFGHEEEMPKNDVPNVSVLMMPWGLDITVNAEIKASQQVMIQKIRRNPTQFDKLRTRHGELGLQTWLKLEHQPRFYHWIQKTRYESEYWDACGLLTHFDDCEKTYVQLRKSSLSWVTRTRPYLSENQRKRLEAANRNLNLAVRIVKTLGSEDQFWIRDYSYQTNAIEREVANLRPLIDFFLE